MKALRGAFLLFTILLCLVSAIYADEALFYVSTAEGDTIFAVYPSGIKVRNETGEDIFIADRDSVRIYVDEDESRTSRGSFAIGGIGSATREPATEYFRVSPDSVRVYLKENNNRTSRGGFAIGGVASATRPGGNSFFNLENTNNPEIITPSEPRLLWYPYKEAFRVGHVLIDSPDSVGTNSLATGYESKAIGDYSQALGYQARALADYSTAIGLHANARGESSFAYGDLAEANGDGSFAFGSVARDTLGNVVYGATAAKADGNYSFALGMGARTGGICSMAIGFNANAETGNSLALGRNTSATGNNSVAIGYGSEASAYNAMAAGFYAEASGSYSTALGYHASAIGAYSLAIGRNNEAEGEFSTAIGTYNQALGDYSVALGRDSVTGDYGTASGCDNEATGDYGVAMGRNNIASGTYAVAMGGYSQATGDYSTAFGRNAIANGTYAVALGGFVTADSSYSVAMGRDSEANNDYAVAIGYSCESNGLYAVSLGYNNTSNGQYSFSTGQTCQSNGYYSFAAGSNSVAASNGAIAIGDACQALDAWTIALGDDTVADGQHAVAIGDGAEATYSNAVAIGEDVTADALNGWALGRRASNGGYYGGFVWGDRSSTSIVTNDKYNQFKVRAAGGYVFHTDSALTEGKTVYISDYEGALGLGTSDPQHKLHLVDTVEISNGTDGAFIDIENTYDTYGAMAGIRFKNGIQTDVFKGGIFFNDATTWGRGNMVFALSNTTDEVDVDRDDADMVIYSNGNIGIGTPENTNPNTKLSVNGSIWPYSDSGGNLGTSTRRWNYIYAAHSTIQTSDRRLKKDINDLNYGLDAVMKLRPVRFKWKDNEDQSDNLGLIAQETQQVIPEVVNVGDDEDQTLGLKYAELVPVLIKAIQEQQQQIEKTQQEVELLKQQLAKEKSRNSENVASSK